MDPLYARYPFFEGAREAVREADISPAALIAEDAPAVERATERVERALMEGTVAAEEPHRWDDRERLLSYPIARILVSLIETPAAVEKYATAEASTARERFAADFAADDDFQSTGITRASLDDVLREFDLSAAVRPEPIDGPGDGRSRRGGRGPTHYWIRIGPYLELADADWGERWRLVNREVADGAVRIPTDGLLRLLEAAVQRRVAGGLPFEVRGTDGGDAIADALEDAVAELRSLLNDTETASTGQIETVVPALFPPCMKALVRRARADESLSTHAEFSLVSFLVALGMDSEDVLTLLGAESGDGEEHSAKARIESRVEYLTESNGTQYPPPSCATMKAYGDCVDPDERCETISHPLSYYTDALRDAGDVRDWRETAGSD
ncbi:DNA primase large subunit PriL [Halobellus captivus]|uniref:DNA primase large subunit PriL n=1 Tax=Halobellus captivus TaxID=2592614 RepID=UPI0011A212A1|nr:DNA primase large subunit PriL [Halobellus captivus]